MSFILGILVAILGLLLVVVIKLSTTFFHELGHAFPALLFTEKSVTVYIGSYGDISNTKYFEFGRLKIYFKLNIMDWKIGMCRHEEHASHNWKTALIILGGPIASLIISLPLFFYLKSIEQHTFLFFLCIVFIAAAVYDLFINLWPFGGGFVMHDGSIAFSDGVALSMLYSRSRLSKEFFELEKLHQAKDYTALIESGKEAIDIPVKGRFAYDFVIAGYTELKEYQSALDTYASLKHQVKLDDNDYFEIGKLYKAANNYQEALKYFIHYKYKHFGDVNLLEELGELYLDMGDEDKGLETANILLGIDSNHFKGRLLKSRALTMFEEFPSAIEEADYAASLNPEDPSVYYQYGLIYEKLNRPKLTLENFQKAKALGCQIHGLDYKIEIAESRI